MFLSDGTEAVNYVEIEHIFIKTNKQLTWANIYTRPDHRHTMLQ